MTGLGPPLCRDCGTRLDTAICTGTLTDAAHGRRDTHPLCDPHGPQKRWNHRAALTNPTGPPPPDLTLDTPTSTSTGDRGRRGHGDAACDPCS